MLKLLIFAPCEKIIVAQEGQTSMIGIIEAVNVGVIEGIVAEAMIPFRWSILTLWQRQGEVEKSVLYQERITLLRPDGSEALKVEAEFEVNNSFRDFRQNIDVPLLPAGVPGEYLLKLFLRKEPEDWTEFATYPFLVTHNPVTNVEIKELKGVTVHEQNKASE